MDTSRSKIVVGIDPGFTNTGICFMQANDILLLDTKSFQEALKLLDETEIALAVVENPNLDSTVFGAYDQFKKLSKKIGERKAFGSLMKKAQHVGNNKAAAKEIITYFKRRNIPVVEVAPSKRQRSYKEVRGRRIRLDPKMLKMPTKLTGAQFKKLTSHESKDEHAHDACTLIYGRYFSLIKMHLNGKI